jgi:hypothetical protein
MIIRHAIWGTSGIRPRWRRLARRDSGAALRTRPRWPPGVSRQRQAPGYRPAADSARPGDPAGASSDSAVLGAAQTTRGLPPLVTVRHRAPRRPGLLWRCVPQGGPPNRRGLGPAQERSSSHPQCERVARSAIVVVSAVQRLAAVETGCGRPVRCGLPRFAARARRATAHRARLAPAADPTTPTDRTPCTAPGKTCRACRPPPGVGSHDWQRRH